MSSVLFRIEIYSVDNFGCPEFGLMGYDDMDELRLDCWKKWREFANSLDGEQK